MISPNISWFEKYRPQDINDMGFSNDAQKNIVKAWIDEETIP